MKDFFHTILKAIFLLENRSLPMNLLIFLACLNLAAIQILIMIFLLYYTLLAERVFKHYWRRKRMREIFLRISSVVKS